MKSLILAGMLVFSAFIALGQTIACTNPPVATVAPLNKFAVAGDSVTFTVEVGGGVAPYFVYWADLDGGFHGSGFQMTLNNVQPSDAKLYYAMVVDQQGCSALTAGKLFVQPSAQGRKKLHAPKYK